MEELLTSQFWRGSGDHLVNIILSGDNAVVIAPRRARCRRTSKAGDHLGRGRGVVLRIVPPSSRRVAEAFLTSSSSRRAAVLDRGEAARAEDGDGDGVKSSSHLLAAIKTILIADLVMSLDNVIWPRWRRQHRAAVLAS